MRRCLTVIALLCLSFVAIGQGATPSASLDRTTVAAGDTATLNIALGDDDDDDPDLAPLGADFIVLGTSTNHTLSVVNGQREAHTILGIALRPRRDGHLTVPALTIGRRRTQPLPLEVTAAVRDQDAGAADRPVLLEGKADPSKAYVGQQIDYTLRLSFAVNLADGQLADPSADGAEIRRVGQDANYQTTRGGRRFNVVERHYAIFAQRPGTLEIHAPTFQGTAVDPSDAGSFFGAGSPVSAVADGVSVQIDARPAGATDGAWLPARALTLSLDGMPADGKARVGQPLSLTMRLDATGLPFEALPALSLPTLDGADVYPEKAETSGSASGPWITGRRQQGFAIVPTRAGRLHLPATTLHWWNVVTGRAEVATLPARDIDVAAGSGVAGSTTPAAASQTGQAGAVAASTPTPRDTAPGATGIPWRWLFVGALALWLLTVLAWFAFGRRRHGAVVAVKAPIVSAPTRERPAHEQFLKVAASADAAGIEQALLRWASAARPSIRSTSELAAALAEGPQRVAIANLQRARYGGGELDRGALRDAFARGFAWRPATTGPGSGDGGLPPLYPR